MSQYPHPYGYGQYHGQQPPPPQLSYPYSYQPVGGYPAPVFNHPYNSSAADLNHGISQASFEYNATSIPGLGAPGAAPSGTHFNPASGLPAWPQHNMIAPPASSAPGYGASSFNAQHPQNTPPGLTASGPSKSMSANTAKQSATLPARPPANLDIEEGELSEGQFEDLYEPRESVPSVAVQAVSKLLPTADPSQPASAADTPEGGFYGTDEDDGEKALRGAEGRDRSASYSPFLSPREIQSGVPTPQPTTGKGNARPLATASKNNNLKQSGNPTPQPSKDSMGSFKSLLEAKKEAQKAILRLWPLGVKYQHYINEGFDENFVKALFHDLHLDIPKTDSPASQPDKKASQQDEASNSTKPSQPSASRPQQPAAVPKESSMTNQSDKGEERKDRIARLLAARATKPPAPAAPMPTPAATQVKKKVAEVQPQTTAQPPAAAAKAKAWGEKERLLQQKIAALQKSRETQAQKPATDIVDSGLAQMGSNGTPDPLQTKTTGSPALVSIPTGPRAGVPRAAVNNQPSPSQPRPPIPGLALQSNSQPHPSGQRKRPVASDFVEYSSGSGAAKRPFGQARKQDSLIIDVSDESDDEEMDMDMDMGSPVDELTLIQSSGTSRGPSIRDFPPLTDTFGQRQFSSPAPSQTPPSGPANNRRPDMELNLKERAIQEMRRKIALAEARRKAKQYSGMVTPKQAGQTPELKETEALRLPPTERAESMSSIDRVDTPSQTTSETPATLPRPSEALRLEPLQRAGRRGRMSLDLQEKLNRLNQLRDEQAQLQAEIDRSVAEQSNLDDELEQLDATVSAESQQPNGLDSGEVSESFVSQPGRAPVDIQKSPSSPTPSASESRESGEISMDEAASSEGQPEGESPSKGSIELEPSAAASVAGAASQSNAGDNVVEAADERTNAAPVGLANDSQQNIEPFVSRDDVNGQAEPVEPSPLTPESGELTESDVAIPSMPEQVNTARADETTPMELDSRSPSPEAVEPNSMDARGEVSEADQPLASLPGQISSVAKAREEVQEIETETAGEVHVVSSRSAGSFQLTSSQVHDESASKPGSSLMPYESPLRYFHAYRFHPEYRNAVTGGLKSLTYSNRINPEKELCPRELNGEQCPDNCEFQHFGAISPPDDQILLELGNPDDYSGEEKSRFIQGLRELLQRFKADKVRDFDTIARAIIEFRSRLLGDSSKVLRLNGVSI